MFVVCHSCGEISNIEDWGTEYDTLGLSAEERGGFAGEAYLTCPHCGSGEGEEEVFELSGESKGNGLEHCGDLYATFEDSYECEVCGERYLNDEVDINGVCFNCRKGNKNE